MNLTSFKLLQSMQTEFSSRPLYKFALIPNINEKLAELVKLAEPEDWEYKRTPSPNPLPILFNYIHYTFNRLEEEGKIAVSADNRYACVNSGLVTANQEPIFVFFTKNNLEGDSRPWHFAKFCRRGEYELSRFDVLPALAHYFDDPSCLVFDIRCELRVNIEHIINENKSRFPAPYCDMDNYALQNFLNGSIEGAKKRVQRNYKAAIPQYYRGRVQLLLPLCISRPSCADLALVVERYNIENGNKLYRASTCLTLDMAYNNARQLARPDRDWLQP
jgi:hypothetical protein